MKRLGMLLVVPPIVPERAIAQAAPAASVSTGPAVRATRVARAPRSCAQHVMKPVNSAATPSSLEGAQALRQGRTEPAMRDALSEPGGSVMSVSFRLLMKRTLYLLAILLMPGALIAAVLLWWLDRRRIRGSAPRPSDA